MLETLTYEEILLRSTRNIVHNDLFNNLKRDKTNFNKGISIKSNKCTVCSQIMYLLTPLDPVNISESYFVPLRTLT